MASSVSKPYMPHGPRGLLFYGDQSRARAIRTNMSNCQTGSDTAFTMMGGLTAPESIVAYLHTHGSIKGTVDGLEIFDPCSTAVHTSMLHISNCIKTIELHGDPGASVTGLALSYFLEVNLAVLSERTSSVCSLRGRYRNPVIKIFL